VRLVISRGLSVLLLVYALGYALFAVLLPRPADNRATDAIVVLTGAHGRIDRGLDLLEQQKAKRMLISGVDRTVRPVELAVQTGRDRRLFECCIDLGRESVDTRSNAEETARWLEKNHFRTVRLVTTDWHMPRASVELSRRVAKGTDILDDAIPSDPNFRQLYTEYNKYLLRHAAVLVGI
jgi:uncharacterized SAM-binding protein YcdF (DUF218 family)